MLKIDIAASTENYWKLTYFVCFHRPPLETEHSISKRVALTEPTYTMETTLQLTPKKEDCTAINDWIVNNLIQDDCTVYYNADSRLHGQAGRTATCISYWVSEQFVTMRFTTATSTLNLKINTSHLLHFATVNNYSTTNFLSKSRLLWQWIRLKDRRLNVLEHTDNRLLFPVATSMRVFSSLYIWRHCCGYWKVPTAYRK
jgi:hypothetical protein